MKRDPSPAGQAKKEIEYPAPTTEPERVTCARCGFAVGLLWINGRSTLVDRLVSSNGQGQLVLTRHECRPGPGNVVHRRPDDR